MLLVTSPPDDPDKVERYFAGTDVEVIRGTTFDNLHNLPWDYIETQRNTLDELTFRREILGELISTSGARAYYAYTERSLADVEFDPEADTWLAWDFNVGDKPMSCIVIQKQGEKYYAVEEFVAKRSNTENTAQAVLEYLEAKEFRGRLEVTGDYAGKRRESSASATDYDIISSFLRHFKKYDVRFRPTRRVRDRVATLNALLRNANGLQRLFICRRCEKLIEDLRKVEWNDDGISLDDSNPERTHPTDALSYWTYNYFPFQEVYGK
jgi:hypothetical protein